MKAIKKVLSVFLAAVSIAAISSTVAQAQTAEFGGTSYPSLNAAVDAANAAGGGTITLSAGTFYITRVLRIERNIDIVGAALGADGMPTSVITYDDTQSFTLNSAGTKYLITVGNYNAGQVDVVANFTNVKAIAGTVANGCPPAAGACVLGAFNYIVSNSTGSVKGTLKDSAAVGGTVGLVINNNNGGICEVTTDGFAVGDHSWGGVNVGKDALLILGPNGVTTPPGDNPDTLPVYGDAATAQVTMPDGTIESLDPATTPRSAVYIYSFDPNGGSINGSAAVKQQDVFTGSSVTAPTATRAGYAFKGWYTDAQGTTQWDDTVLPTGNTTIYAIWTKDAGQAPVSVPVSGGGMLVVLGMLLAGLGVVMLRRNRLQ
jgi:uncharacterized repeat protein (TIGR02543 family)